MRAEDPLAAGTREILQVDRVQSLDFGLGTNASDQFKKVNGAAAFWRCTSGS